MGARGIEPLQSQLSTLATSALAAVSTSRRCPGEALRCPHYAGYLCSTVCLHDGASSSQFAPETHENFSECTTR